MRGNWRSLRLQCCSEKVSIDLMGGAPQSRLSITDIPHWAGMFWLWKHPLFSAICWKQPCKSWPLKVALEGKTVITKSCQWSTFLEAGFFLKEDMSAAVLWLSTVLNIPSLLCSTLYTIGSPWFFLALVLWFYFEKSK